LLKDLGLVGSDFLDRLGVLVHARLRAFVVLVQVFVNFKFETPVQLQLVVLRFGGNAQWPLRYIVNLVFQLVYRVSVILLTLDVVTLLLQKVLAQLVRKCELFVVLFEDLFVFMLEGLCTDFKGKVLVRYFAVFNELGRF